jgi:hypothetical protein
MAKRKATSSNRKNTYKPSTAKQMNQAYNKTPRTGKPSK